MCTSTDPRDRRTRHGALLELESGTVLIDTPPELRLQLLDAGVRSVDAVWYTHGHADHVHGIDDLRAFTAIQGRRVRAFIPEGTTQQFHDRFPYIFDPSVLPQRGTSKPTLQLTELDPSRPVDVCGAQFLPLPVPHGPMTVFGFRVGDLAYVTDAKTIPEGVLDRMTGVRVLVLNALWIGNPHPTHFNVEEAVEMADRIGADRTYLTHLTHRVGHEQLQDFLPDRVSPAYDGLEVEI